MISIMSLWSYSDYLIHKKCSKCYAIYKKSEFQVLDLGCGTGKLLHDLARFYCNAEFVGLDSNENSIRQAELNNLSNCKFIKGQFYKTADLGEFDIVICSEVFEHVEDSARLLSVLSERVRNGGYLSISTPSGWMFRMPRPFNIRMLLSKPVKFFRLYLYPEKNWSEALYIHPAIQPDRLISSLKAYGFSLIHRQSSLWLISERGLLFRLLRANAKRKPIKVGIQLYHHVARLDALMNVIPLFRVFESRFVLLMEKRL